jgi:hypothetical protein
MWILVSVYGAAQDRFKANFLRELVNLAKDDPHPIMIGGISIFLVSNMRKRPFQ